MKEPFGPILQHLAHQVYIHREQKGSIPKLVRITAITRWYRARMFVEWKPDDYVKLKRFEDYWERKARSRKF